jgi:hypothetical protein
LVEERDHLIGLTWLEVPRLAPVVYVNKTGAMYLGGIRDEPVAFGVA